MQAMDENELLIGGSEEASKEYCWKEKIWSEEKKIWRIGFPAILARVTQFGMLVVTQAFIGHIGSPQLAAYSLVQIIVVRFANGILVGMSSATETLCGQAYGAKQYSIMGIYLQQSLIINIATATILLPVFIFASPIFILLGEESQVSQVAGNISLWFIPTVYSLAIVFPLQKFLQTQLKNMIVGWVSAISFGIHVFLSWILVTELEMGISGAMIAMSISNSLVIIGTLIYIFGGWCPTTWGGFTFAAFSDLYPAIKLSISSGIMICLEFWYTAVLVLLAGYMENGTTAISAFSICLNIISLEFMLCLGFLTSASVRVSNELGRGDAKAAKYSIKVLFMTSLMVGVFFMVICIAFGDKIAYLFTDEKPVAAYVKSLSILLAFSVLLNSFQAVYSGAAIGAGRQSIVAYVNMICYYVIGVPLGVLLGYKGHLQVQGIWIGMIVGVVLQCITLAYLTSTTDWEEQVTKASQRLNRGPLKSSDEAY